MQKILSGCFSVSDDKTSAGRGEINGGPAAELDLRPVGAEVDSGVLHKHVATGGGMVVFERRPSEAVVRTVVQYWQSAVLEAVQSSSLVRSSRCMRKSGRISALKPKVLIPYHHPKTPVSRVSDILAESKIGGRDRNYQ